MKYLDNGKELEIHMTYHDWKDLALFYSVESTQKFLEKVYVLNGADEAKQNSFKNSERFIFFLKHAESFYKQASCSPLEIKPILLFYGMSQLIKACLITQILTTQAIHQFSHMASQRVKERSKIIVLAMMK